MAEWLVAHDIGQTRAALVENGQIIAARLAHDSDGLPAGAVVAARLINRRDGIARADGGEEIFIGAPRADWPTEGARCTIAIRRPAIPERGLVKRAMGSIVTDAAPGNPGLTDQLLTTGVAWRDDVAGLDEAGWHELVEEARTGQISFEGGLLRVEGTAAMTVIDVDGAPGDNQLPIRAAAAAAAAIARLDIGGNIVIDLPAMASKTHRQDADRAFDAAMALTGLRYERTATNGYGLLQVIVPRVRQSLIERWRFAPVESAALDLLRLASRARGTGALTLTAAPQLINWLSERPMLIDRLARAAGRSVALQVDQRLGIVGGHAQ